MGKRARRVESERDEGREGRWRKGRGNGGERLGQRAA